MAKTAYTKVNVEGFTLNARTAALYAQVKIIFPLLGGKGKVYIAQGSYSNSVGASAGTHDGGGVLDLSLSFKSQDNWEILERAVRWVQIAGWHRTPLYQNGRLIWSDHVHGVVIGDISAAPLAKRQVDNYRDKDDGLASHNPDHSWRPDVLFTPSYPLASYSLADVKACAKKKGGNVVPRSSVKAIQNTLNLKLKTKLKVDGKFGPTTKAAYKKWEDKTGVTGAALDGIPGPRNLILLGAGRFNVKV